eukprot:GHVR01127220.1.p2 GENE.GHVR01127220.1~~GHVR01127220.1.p2  ORF type:complete len:110 (+),score=15.95 GHVR01127220.1:111-440(+)
MGMNKDRVEELARLASVSGASEVDASEVDAYSEFVVLSNELLMNSDRAELVDLGYEIFYENNLVPRLFGVRNAEGSVEELDALAFVEKASESTLDQAEIMEGELDGRIS